MAFPQVEATNTSSEDGLTVSHTVSLPTGIQVGETLLVFFVREGFTEGISWPAGWNSIIDKNTNNVAMLGIAWRKATGGEGATITVTTGASNARSAHASYRISGATDPTVTAPEASTGVIGANAIPDPDSLTAGGGSDEYLWIAVEGNDGPRAVTVYPTNYDSNQLTKIATGGVGIGVASDEVETDTQDPGTFTIDAADQWAACTVAVYPALVVVGTKSANMAAKMMARGLI